MSSNNDNQDILHHLRGKGNPYVHSARVQRALSLSAPPRHNAPSTTTNNRNTASNTAANRRNPNNQQQHIPALQTPRNMNTNAPHSHDRNVRNISVSQNVQQSATTLPPPNNNGPEYPPYRGTANQTATDNQPTTVVAISKPLPTWFRKPIYITVYKGANKADRNWQSWLQCNSDPDSVEGGLRVMARKEKINIDIECFRFSWCTLKGLPDTIHDYRLAGIDFDILHHFTFKQIADPSEEVLTSLPKTVNSTPSKDRNKVAMARNNNAMEMAECNLRRDLDSRDWQRLKRNGYLLAKWKYDISLGEYKDCNIDEFIKQQIRAELDDAESQYKQRFPNRSLPALGPNVQAQNHNGINHQNQMNGMKNTMETMMNLIMMQTMRSMMAQPALPAPTVAPTMAPSQMVPQQPNTTTTVSTTASIPAISLPPIHAEPATALAPTTIPTKDATASAIPVSYRPIHAATDAVSTQRDNPLGFGAIQNNNNDEQYDVKGGNDKYDI